jgi:hypothetical protein
MNCQRVLGALAVIGFTSAVTVGCEAHAEATGTAEAQAPVAFVEAPTLVAVDSGVWVVRDSDRPVYFVEDSYWVYREGVWYRSRSYDSGWIVVEARIVPTVIVSRNHAQYVHYHGEATAQTRIAPRGGEAITSGEAHRENVREHEHEHEHEIAHPHEDGPPPGAVKKEEKKEEREEKKIEKREDRREDRRDDRHDEHRH